MYKFCYSLAFSKEEAEDLFQETFLKAFENVQRGVALANPLGYFISTALFTWKSWKRKHARRNQIATFQALPAQLPVPDDTAQALLAQEEMALVQQIVHQLPDKFKIPTLLYYSAQASVGQIATALSIPEGTVKSRLFKARQLIEKRLKQHGYE